MHASMKAIVVAVVTLALAGVSFAQKPPYDVFPPAEATYYRVRYEASTTPGELAYSVNYTIWIPPGVKSLRGVIVHQHAHATAGADAICR